ncbi:MAG TPA: pYEATS domain-containing protein [Chitinophagaceae bacterium]|nr:pYEATS domain-containing protein [Chitinophagaceae bacterium]
MDNRDYWNSKPIFEKKDVDVWRFLFITLLVGIALVMFFCVRTIIFNAKVGHNVSYFFSAVGTAMLSAGASFCGGALLGFLFGIPRILQSPVAASEINIQRRASVLQNDNLVQISDWLTKIIVGVGLTQLYNIPPAIDRMGVYLISSFGGSEATAAIGNNVARNGAIVTVLYFIIVGFLCAYLWTRLHFSRMLAQNERDLEEVLKEKEEELNALTATFKEDTERLKSDLKTSKDSNDPHKNQFGGQSKANGREIKANVTPTSFDPDLFTVALEVTSTDTNRPLTGDVTFYLHPTFRDPVRKVTPVNGVANLSIISYGAFTVGVESDEGKTRLEIDLAQVAGIPEKFKQR